MKLSKLVISCGSITAHQILKLSKTGLDLELRLDLLGLNALQISNLVKKLSSNIIVTCRETKLLSLETRRSLLQTAINAGAQYLDVDIDDGKLLPLLTLKKVRVIRSYHNYSVTPSQKTLLGISKKLKSSGANVIKIATTVKKVDDYKTLLSLIDSHFPTVIVGMCKSSTFRIVAPILGGAFTYVAPSPSNVTAPGQLDYKKALQVYSILKEDIR